MLLHQDIKSSDVNADEKCRVAMARVWGQDCDLQQGDPLPFSLPNLGQKSSLWKLYGVLL